MERTHRIGRALTGLAAGALLTAVLLGAFALGGRLSLPSVGLTVFEWLIRVLPGRLVIFGLETTLRVLTDLGLNIKNTAKTAEEALALSGLFVAGCLVGLLFFSVVRSREPLRVSRYGRAVGAVIGLFSLVVTFIEQPPAGAAADFVTPSGSWGSFSCGAGAWPSPACARLPPLSRLPPLWRRPPPSRRPPPWRLLRRPRPTT